MKLCPFRKATTMIHYENNGIGHPVNTIEEEQFLECIGKECMAWFEEEKEIHDGMNYRVHNKGCKLIDK